jgi:hypothetical protein
MPPQNAARKQVFYPGFSMHYVRRLKVNFQLAEQADQQPFPTCD